MKKYLSLMTNKTKLKCMAMIAMAAASSFLASVWPVLLGDLYTDISDGVIGTLAQGAIPVVTFGLIYLSAECITIFRRVALDCIIATHESEIRRQSIEKLLKMPVMYYADCPSGEKTAQLNQGVAGLSQLIKIMCNDVFSTVLTAVCTLIQVFLNAPLMIVGIMTLYLTATVIISIFQIHSQNGIREKIISKKNALDGQVCQSISNLELIRSMNAEAYEAKRLGPEITDISAAEKKHHRYMGSFDCLKQLCKVLFQAALLIVSLILISKHLMSAGAVITICLLFQQLVKPIDEVYRFMDETASAVLKARTLTEVMSGSEDPVFEIKGGSQRIKDGGNSDAVKLKNVVVTDPSQTKVIGWYDDITIPSGSRAALKGPSGCGKTTLIRCLERYYPHTQGKVTIFGIAQSDYSQKEIADMICYVPQNTFFFAGTLEENLVYGLSERPSAEKLNDALERSCLAGAYEGAICTSAEKALEHEITEGAANLSGGQRQRLSLARAFLRSPKLYVLDESTANLDAATAQRVLDNIEAHADAIGASIVYISHDKNVVERCETVINLINKASEFTTVPTSPSAAA